MMYWCRMCCEDENHPFAGRALYTTTCDGCLEPMADCVLVIASVEKAIKVQQRAVMKRHQAKQNVEEKVTVLESAKCRPDDGYHTGEFKKELWEKDQCTACAPKEEKENG